MKYQPEDIWDLATWAGIDEAVAEEVKRVGVARRAFLVERVMAADGTAPSWISGAAMQTRGAGVAQRLFIPEGNAQPFVEISVGFTLTGAQVENEGSLHMGRTLARMAAKNLALAEDAFVLMGIDAAGKLPASAPTVARVTGNASGAIRVGIASGPTTGQVQVTLPAPTAPLADAIALLQTVTDVVSQLATKNWPGPYALILGPGAYDRAWSQLVANAMETPADRLRPLAKQIIVSAALADGGVVVSLAGDPTTIYIACDATTAFVGATLDDDGVFYNFRVFERIQYAVTDPLSIGLLLPSTASAAAPAPSGRQ